MNKKRLFILILDGALVLFALVARYIADLMITVLPDCIYAQRGILCPSCGGTRCVRNFFSGRFAEAFVLNPFIFLLIIYLGIALLLGNVGCLFGHRLSERISRGMVSTRAIIILAILFAVFGLVRMVLHLL